ncbi:hypothetical protein BGW38_002232 [Lunasporangiospora selenospora]|uniref:Enolase-phosphatase E1 n=1 Tax=Lunasporangiospora selenospora TaxID=979761 RepID=A0A9P6KD15_9FUNG|nr:hypothetical protein BGW38_002232 [Lunasporangiospora selenospora]
MVVTRSRSSNQGAAPAATATKPAAPAKRKSNAASTKAAKAAKSTNGSTPGESKDEEDANGNDTLPASETASDNAQAIAEAETTKTVVAAEPTAASKEEPTTQSEAGQGSLQSYDIVVTDIEGTTTPIVFVKNVLFPYVTSHMQEFLKKNWASEELKSKIEGLRTQATKDIADNVEGATPIPVESEENPAEKVQQAILASIEWQMKADRKIGALKDFQGYMWAEGYANGELKGSIYDDVTKALDQWKSDSKKLYIYSSGSVPAQKLIFGFSDKGDLLHYFSGYYDTNIGLKVEVESYTKIAADIGAEPAKILFLSDNIREIEAAKKAGFQAVILDRPGNEPLSDEARSKHIVVKSFLDIPKPL